MNKPAMSKPAMSKLEVNDSAVLQLVDIHKSYGSLEVLKGLSLSVEAGEVYGFLGRNGAGKSTALRIMIGITRADRGHIRLFSGENENVVRNRQRIGYVAQEQNFYRWMTPASLGKFVSGFYPRWSQEQFRKLVDHFSLPLKQKIGTFSGGMKAKLALSVALSTCPDILILDEPTAGMDPIARREFLHLVREQAIRVGATILFSTHLIGDVEAVANRICIVENGVALYEGGLRTLTKSIRTFSSSAGVGSPLAPVGAGLFNILQTSESNDRKSIIVKSQPSDGKHVLDRFFSSGWREESMSLEDVFVSLVSVSGRP